MSDGAVRRTLASFGLSEKEIDAYLAVLEAGTATTRTVSAAADVSQSYVYEIAAELADRGLITIDEGGSPTTLRARPPADAVDALAAQLEGLEESLAAVYSAPPDDHGEFEVVHARQTARKRAERLVADATDEVFLAITDGAFETLAPAMADATERGVYVYCMLVAREPRDPFESIETPGDYAVVLRTWDSPAPTFVIRDMSAGLLGSHAVLEGRHDEGYAFLFSHPEVAGSFHGNMLSNIWPMGEEAFVAEPPPLPATFEHVPNAVTTVAIHRRAGTSLVADVDALDLRTEERRTLEQVPVREARQSVVEPANTSFPIENSLVVETEEGLVSVGASAEGHIGPYYEELAAEEIRLSEA